MRQLLLLALLATPLGAQPTDTYRVVFLRPTPDRKALPKEEGERLQNAHMANIQSMADRGILVAAGPFGDTPPTISGVFVMKSGSLEEALRMAAADPTVAAHRNTVDGFTWIGPKGVGEEYRRLHAADPKTPEDMGVHPFVLLHGTPDGAELARWRAEKKLVAAGPIEGGGPFRYLLVLARIPDAEARRLVPAGLQPEFHRWWSAAHVFPE